MLCCLGKVVVVVVIVVVDVAVFGLIVFVVICSGGCVALNF